MNKNYTSPHCARVAHNTATSNSHTSLFLATFSTSPQLLPDSLTYFQSYVSRSLLTCPSSFSPHLVSKLFLLCSLTQPFPSSSLDQGHDVLFTCLFKQCFILYFCWPVRYKLFSVDMLYGTLTVSYYVRISLYDSSILGHTAGPKGHYCCRSLSWSSF